MASFDPSSPPSPDADAPAPTGIQTRPDNSAPNETPSIPLPPLPRRRRSMSPEAFTALRRWLDVFLVALVLGFAFLVASFPASNPDFFRQAGVGQLLVRGEYHFGSDPFTFAGEQVYWVNHSWLFGLLMYALYQIPTFGGTIVVVFKALLIAALAEILLRASRHAGQSLWIPAVCTALAILTISPRLYLQSSCLSFLFLGLTLWLLIAFRAGGGKRVWWLVPLFALWANCDQWFFLGPVTVALFALGEWISSLVPPPGVPPEELPRPRLKTLALVLVGGLAACLLNPHHVRVFAAPTELSLTATDALLRNDLQFRSQYLSPLSPVYRAPNHGGSVAGWAYAPLLLVSLLSFGFLRVRTPWWRLVVWLPFALLGLYSARCLPFFAIVAGPIAALNWLDFAAGLKKRPELVSGDETNPEPVSRGWAVGGRVLSLGAVLALLIATVPGWLQARPHEYRRVGWRVVVDPSLRETAEQIHAWREQGLLPDEPHWFNLHQEVSNYLAYFAPGERVFLDPNLPRFPAAAGDYQAIREALETQAANSKLVEEELTSQPSTSKSRLRQRLRDLGVRFWIFDNVSVQTADKEARRLLFSNPDEWVLCSLHGRAAIFAWHDPAEKEKAIPSERLKLDLKRLAFGPEAVQAPPQGPEVVVPTRELWEQWLYAPPPAAVDRQTASMYDLLAQTAGRRQRMLEMYQNSRAWQAFVTVGGIGAALPGGPMPRSLLALSWSCTYHDLFPPGKVQPSRAVRASEVDAMRMWNQYVNSRVTEPPAALYLALRAARRGLLENPQDPHTHLLLGQVYAQLDSQPNERSMKAASAFIEEIRRTQLVAAYSNCLRLQPTPMMAGDAHAVLFQMFDRLQYRDVAANHLRELLSSRRMLKPEELSLTATQYAQALDEMGRELKRREEEIDREQRLYVVSAANKPALEKVAIALQKGLVETALSALNQARPEEMSGQKDLAVVRAVMTTLLNLGRLDEARRLLIPEPEKTAGQPIAPEYLFLHLRLAAARGDYDLADKILADALNNAWKDSQGHPVHYLEKNAIAVSVARVLLGEAQQLGGPRFPLPRPDIASEYYVRLWRFAAIDTSLRITQQRVEWHLLRGWLAVESGRCEQARESFLAALDTMVPPPEWVPEINKLKVLSARDSPREAQFLQELAALQGITLGVTRIYLGWLEEARR